MSKIQEMIDRMCPDGVDYIRLKDLCESIKDGMHNLPKSSRDGGDYPIISAQNIHDNSIDYKAIRFVDKDTFEKENKRTNVEVGNVLLTIVATIGRSAVVKEDRPVLLQRSVCVLKPNKRIISDYLKYCLDKTDLQQYMLANAHGSAQAGLYLNQVEDILIPVPPIDVQREIVKVLDSFSDHSAELVTELKAELAARKMQYVHYQKAVVEELTQGSPTMALAEICSVITDGSHFSPSATDTEECYYMPSVKDMHDNCFDFSSCKRIGKRDYEELVSNGCQPHLNDVLIAKDGATMLKYVFVVKEEKEIVVLSSIAILRPKLDLVYPEYLSHYFKQEWFRQYVINKFSSKAGVPRIVLKNFKRIEIPVPSIEAQKRIVSILDRFEALTASLSESLPSEIKARQQQYEYYRDQLLTFKRAN